MPIPIRDLKTQPETGFSLTPGTQKTAALRVLVANPDTAFKPKEIATRADIPADNTPTVCRRLTEMGAAATEKGYYYLPQDDVKAAEVRRSLASAHQQRLAQQTAAADEAALAAGADDIEPISITEEDVDDELLDLEAGLSDI